MTNYLFVIGVAVMGGLAAVVQAQFNSIMNKGMGTLESVFITYGLGGVVVGLLMLAHRGGNLRAFVGLPWYVLLAGLCGLVIIGSISYTVPRLGLVTTFTVIVATQFILGSLFDHFGVLGMEIRPLTLQKISGILILLMGVWLVMRS